MPRFLIEVPHAEEVVACAKVVQVFLSTCSHFLSHADWGCLGGEHKAWIIVEVETKEEARCIIPPAFRAQARIVQLNYFTLEEMEDILRRHKH